MEFEKWWKENLERIELLRKEKNIEFIKIVFETVYFHGKHSENVPLREKVDINVGKRSVRFKFVNGSGIGVRRDNPDYLSCVGEWFCNEVDALPIEMGPELKKRLEEEERLFIEEIINKMKGKKL